MAGRIRLSGLSRATIARLENGTLANPDASKLGKLEDLLGLQLKANARRTTRRHALRMASRSRTGPLASIGASGTVTPVRGSSRPARRETRTRVRPFSRSTASVRK